MNYFLLLATAGMFAYQLHLGDNLELFLRAHAFVPSEFKAALAAERPERLLEVLLGSISYTFLHGGWFHVIGNLLYLRVFGDNVEDQLGHLPFVLFYFASGIAGAFGHYLSEPNSGVPLVGASGAIAGVLGAYVVMFPRAKIVTLFPIFIVLTFIEVPAFVFLGIWAAQQLLNGSLVLQTGLQDGVAWFAHLGGFALGLVVGTAWRMHRWYRRSKRMRR